MTCSWPRAERRRAASTSCRRWAASRDGNWEWIAPHPDGRLSVLGTHRTAGFAFYTVRPDGQSPVAASPFKAVLETMSGEETHPRRRFVWSPNGESLRVQASHNGIEAL
jgi:hypothetical protein